MMTLASASTFFDRTTVTDLAGAVLFLCQVDPFDESKRDSGPAYRRIMSVKPGTVMPASRTVHLLGKTWAIGVMEPDGQAELHREKYVIHPVPLTLSVSTLSGYLSATVATTVRASAHWIKDTKQLETSSRTPPLYDVTMALGLPVEPLQVVWAPTEAYLTLSAHEQASGLLTLTSLLLDDNALGAVTVASRTYDPVAGGYVAGTSATQQALFVRWQSLFEYGSQMSERYQEGDVSIVLATGTSVNTSTTITRGAVTYQVLTVLDIAGAVVAHARRV